MSEDLSLRQGILNALLLRTRQVSLSAAEAELDDKNKRIAALEHEVAAAETAVQQQRKEMQAEILKRDTEILTLETELARLRAAVAQQSRELEVRARVHLATCRQFGPTARSLRGSTPSSRPSTRRSLRTTSC